MAAGPEIMQNDRTDPQDHLHDDGSDRRSRWAARVRSGETAEQRMERFAALQQHAFELLQSSPDGFAHFLKRNYRLRRAEFVDGSWQPVETDRHPPLP